MIPEFMMVASQVEQDPRGSLVQLERIIDLAQKYDHKQIEAHALAAKGWAHARIGEYAQAEENLRHAHELVPAANSPVTEADVNTFSSWSYFEMGNSHLAVEYGRLAAEQALTAQGLECGTVGMFVLGLGHLQAQNLDEAVTTLDEAIRLGDDLQGMKEFMPRVRATRAAACLLSGHSEALDELKQALAHTRALGDHYWVAFISQYLGQAYTELGELERAEEYFNAAVAYYRSTGIYPSLAHVLHSLSELYERQGREADTAHARAEAHRVARQLHRTAAQ